MSNRKLQKEVETVFKKIHEGLDLFNYYFSRHEASSNDSQREKLESDLKKEIKKLQKFRDQIKNWQGNDSLEATIASSKLQEHRRLVEEAMECYKEVEKHSKMKSFSNQSIMLAARDNGEQELSPDVEEAYEYVSGVIDELTAQNERLDEDYEKLSQKKVRKNNMSAIDERKQEIETLKSRNDFHIEKLEAVQRFLKADKVSVDSVWAIQDDLNFYVESNQEPDFVDDETLYDELIKEAREHHENDTTVSNGMDNSADISLSQDYDTSVSEAVAETTESSAAHPTSKTKTISSSPAAHRSASPSSSDAGSKSVASSKGKQSSRGASVEPPTPTFVTTLKPASTPSKPVSGLKWSLAAAGASQKAESSSISPSSSKDSTLESQILRETSAEAHKPAVVSNATQEPQLAEKNEMDASSELLSLLTKNEVYAPYLDVLKNSNLAPVELELFSDNDLLSAPLGLQEFVVAFAAANKFDTHSSILVQSDLYDPYTESLQKQYLPQGLSQMGQSTFKPPLFINKLRGYWNRIRTSKQFDQFLDELAAFEDQNSLETSVVANELTMVLFYGYYYGLLPLENIIAESMLFKMGWRPYDIHSEVDAQAPNTTRGFQAQVWLKKVGSSSQVAETSTGYESGDFKVFDLNSWEIQMKYGFKFDPSLSRSSPAKALS